MKHSAGFTLFEILLTLSILSIAVLGINEYQLKSIQYTQAAITESRVINLLNEWGALINLGLFHPEVAKKNLTKDLVDGKIEFHQSELTFTWPARINHWECASSSQRGYSCLSMPL